MTPEQTQAMRQALEFMGAVLGTLTHANEQGAITDTIWYSEHETLFDAISYEMDALRQALEQKSGIKQVIELYDSPEQQPTQCSADEPVASMEALKDAFFEGFTSVETYNDTRLNSPEEAWLKYKPSTTRPAIVRAVAEIGRGMTTLKEMK